MSDDPPPIRDGLVLRICSGQSCGGYAGRLEAAAREHIRAQGLEAEVALASHSCFGRCFRGPNLAVERWRDGRRNDQAMLALMLERKHPDLRMESGVRPEDVPKLIDWHLAAWRRHLAKR
ncbi:MAG: (2Fe-2S) ferredoxin domain-containing protein [Deltaproteobacteria bacterium]|nr:(2Fe-2S) ferredoxin domain-containing protein [Deltaproteobacteria bacterium]